MTSELRRSSTANMGRFFNKLDDCQNDEVQDEKNS